MIDLIARKLAMTARAKLFMHGRSQAVQLPKAFRLPGAEARASMVGHKVILEPIEEPEFDVDAWYARLDALGGAELFPEGPPPEPPSPTDPRKFFDR